AVIQNELGFRTTTSYDAAGRPTTVLDANNWLQTLVFDAVGQQTAAVYGDGIVTQAYDPVGNRTTMQDETGTTTFAYSARYELIRVSSPGGLVVSYQHERGGNRLKMDTPDGGRTTYTYEPINRLEAQVMPTGEIYTTQYD